MGKVRMELRSGALVADTLPQGQQGGESQRKDMTLHCLETSSVTVGTSAFLACHQCYCAGPSLAWGLNLWAVVCGIF